MDNKKKLLLQRYQRDIVRDLDISYIIDALFTKHAISADDLNEIFNRIQNNNRTENARYLIDTLLQKGDNNSYEAFVDCLNKDYPWLWKKLAEDNNEPMLNESFEDSLSRGDVPRLPMHYVKRVAVEKEIESRLFQLARHNILALHGMSGSGKTSAAISVLRDNSELITNNFNGVVFWLSLGNCRTEDDVIAQQNKLYRKASSIYTRNTSHMNSTMSMSSFGSNFETQSLSSSEWTYQELRDRLKSQFSEPVLKDALLVLDEVNERLCVEAFDIGCKILVTTRDSEVVSSFHPQIIKVENNLKEEETLKLLASYLDLEVSQLPRQARKFHEACKGSPFNIALIGAQLAEDKERLIDDNRRWNYYLSKLEKKDFFFLLRHNDNQMKPIAVCINSLKPDILPLFKMLAVLPDNVKVSARVLSKLWNKSTSEVEVIMRKLRIKSLVIELYDHDQRNYLYEVHDLIMNYLRTCGVTDDETKKLHSDFLKSYQYDVNKQPPVEITDDGYIAFYIGYHIQSTKNLYNRWKLFNMLYLDLKFLGNKVRLTGPADVILDLQKYENHIVNDELDRDLLCNIRAYLSTHGIDLYRYPCTDVVQSILQHESKGILYTKASSVAQKCCAKNELYFEFEHQQDVEEIKHSTIDVKEVITAVCFLGDYVLVGTITGLIKFFHIPTNKLKKDLTGTGSSIKWIGACPINPPQVAALSYDGVIKLWYIDEVERDESDDVIDEESEEPEQLCSINNCMIPPKMGPFLNCRWANNDEVLITHTAKMIIIYSHTGSVLKVYDNFDRDQEILCCIPCNMDRYLITAISSGDANYLVLINQSTKEKIMTFEETDTVLGVVTVPGTNKIITLKSKEITEHEYKINYQNNCNTYRCKQIISSRDVNKDSLMFLTMAVNKTGSLLFASTDDSRIVCIDLKTNSRVFDLENRRGNVVSMDVSETAVWNDFEPGSDVLLTGTGTIENSAKVWNLNASYVLQTTQKNGKVRLTKKFDVSFAHAQSPQTPSTTASSTHSASNTPRRHQSFVTPDAPKRPVMTSLSLDRTALKPLNLKGICNNNDGSFQPFLAVVDDKNNIQVTILDNSNISVIIKCHTPRLHQSFVTPDAPKRPVMTSLSLDRTALKPLNLKGICNNNDGSFQPFLAVVDDKNNIQVTILDNSNISVIIKCHTPRLHQSFVTPDAPKRPVMTSLSLDRTALKPLNLKGICNNNDGSFQPFLAVVDDKNNIQVMRGRKVLTEILTQPDDEITTVKISPCNLYIIYGLRSGTVKKYSLRSKVTKVIMDMYAPVHYLNFVNPHLLIAGSKNCSLMAHRLTSDGDWKTVMLHCGNANLGSQELLNDWQGIKKKNSHTDTLSSSGSDSSMFLNGDSKGRLRGICGLVDCFYVRDIGLITVESNGVVKLWDSSIKLESVLHARQADAQVACAALQHAVLALCDASAGFTTFELKKVGNQVELNLIQDYRWNNRITSCDLTSDGLILAMGLDCGDVVVWNVRCMRQLRLLKHHKSPVQWCGFSPVGARLQRSQATSPATPSHLADDDAPLVLVTLASEIVWWNVTYVMKMRANKSHWRTGRNVVTPLLSPNDNRNELSEAMEGLNLSSNNFFFGNGSSDSQDCWKSIWKGKKFKEGSKKKEILSCIKLTGMNAKKLSHDDKFACFVTVDNSGHVHIMNVMKENT